MHLTALLSLVAAFIPAVTPVPAPSPQSTEIDIHLELTSKEGADISFSNEPKAKAAKETDAHAHAHHHLLDHDTVNTDATPPGHTLPYVFSLKGHLIQGLETIAPLPPIPFYDFAKIQLGEQGILSATRPSTFRLHNGKLLIGGIGGVGDNSLAVGLHGRFQKTPVPAVLVHPQQALNFTATPQLGGKKLILTFQDQRFTFLGPKFISGIGDRVEVGLRPRELNLSPHPPPLPPLFPFSFFLFPFSFFLFPFSVFRLPFSFWSFFCFDGISLFNYHAGFEI